MIQQHEEKNMKYDLFLITNNSYLCNVLDSYRYQKSLVAIDSAPYSAYTISDKSIRSSERGIKYKNFLLSESEDSFKDSFLGTCNELYSPILNRLGYQSVGIAVNLNGKERFSLYPLSEALLKSVPEIFQEVYSRYKTVDLWYGGASL